MWCNTGSVPLVAPVILVGCRCNAGGWLNEGQCDIAWSIYHVEMNGPCCRSSCGIRIQMSDVPSGLLAMAGWHYLLTVSKWKPFLLLIAAGYFLCRWFIESVSVLKQGFNNNLKNICVCCAKRTASVKYSRIFCWSEKDKWSVDGERLTQKFLWRNQIFSWCYLNGKKAIPLYKQGNIAIKIMIFPCLGEYAMLEFRHNLIAVKHI